MRQWTAAEQVAHRQILVEAGLIPAYHCLACLRGEHVEDCQGPGCRCRCRALAGPFGDGDPTAPGLTDWRVA